MSGADSSNAVSVLELTLHDRLVGYLVGFKDGRNALSFAAEFRDARNRPTFSLNKLAEWSIATLATAWRMLSNWREGC